VGKASAIPEKKMFFKFCSSRAGYLDTFARAHCGKDSTNEEFAEGPIKSG
jgi:hypothetical protein